MIRLSVVGLSLLLSLPVHAQWAPPKNIPTTGVLHQGPQVASPWAPKPIPKATLIPLPPSAPTPAPSPSVTPVACNQVTPTGHVKYVPKAVREAEAVSNQRN